MNLKFLIMYFDPHVTRMFVEAVSDSGEARTVLSSHYNFIARNDLVAQIVEAPTPEEAKKLAAPGYKHYEIVFSHKFNLGYGVRYEQATNSFYANQFGFIVLDQTHGLHLIIPFQVSKDKLRGYYYVHQANSGKMPNYLDVDEVIKHSKIISPVSQQEVEKELGEIVPADGHVHKLLVAKSNQEPVTGIPEYFIPLIDLSKHAGKMMEGGRIDFKEQSSIIQVKKGQEVLKHFPEILPVEGVDIYGNKAPAPTEKIEGYKPGENIVPLGNSQEIYASSIDGCLDINKKTIHVKAVLTITGDVSYETGNIDFNGAVKVTGNVDAGFTIKASGDVEIEQSVDRANIEAGGNILVKMGISGNAESKIKAKGNIQAKFLLSSNVEADGEIIIDDSIVNSYVFSNKKIVVAGKHGKIMGGETIALNSIEVNTVGSLTVTNTILSVGRNLELERKLDVIRAELTHVKTDYEAIMNKLSMNFGENFLQHPQANLQNLPEFKKKLCIELLTEQSRLHKNYKEKETAFDEMEKELVLEIEPFIVIKDKIFPGSTINIKKRVYKVEKEIMNARFFDSVEEKEIRYTSAN